MPDCWFSPSNIYLLPGYAIWNLRTLDGASDKTTTEHMFLNSFHKNPIPNNVYPIAANAVTAFTANFLCSALGHGPWFGWLSRKIKYSAKSIWWQAFVRSVTAEYAQNKHDYVHTHTYIRKLFYIFACLTLFLIIVHSIGEPTIDDHIILATHHADDIICYSWNMW